MPRIAIRHAHKLAYRRRLSLGPRMLGCLVMLAGAIVLAAALAELAKGLPSREARIMIALGPMLFASGAALFFGERGLLLDRETRTLKRWWGAIVPLRRTVDDISHYQAAGIRPSVDSALRRWCVCLFDAQGEQIELFELATEEVAQFAARQVASFLSLPVAPPPSVDYIVAVGPVTASAAPAQHGAPPAGPLWTYRSRFGLVPRGIGMLCFVLGLMLSAGLVGAANLGSGRWLVMIAAAAPLCLVGIWLIAGGRKALLDAEAQTVKLWRAWPLPPAVYELPAFYAVIVAPESTAATDEQPPHSIGLVDAEQSRLLIVRGLPRDEALSEAAQLAAAARLPLVDEPLTATPADLAKAQVSRPA